MLVTFRTVELFAILALTGFPFSWALLGVADKTFATPLRVLLAPITGLACLGVGSGLMYAFGIPINEIVLPFWLSVIAAWVVLGAVTWRNRAHRLRVSPWRVLAVAAGASVPAGFGLVGFVYLWPFLQDSQLVFWHYAGSDGYMYMRIAEFVGRIGAGQDPTVRIYDAASGWLLEEMLHFHAALFVDKPATMGILAALAAIMGLLPHETFSPLMITSLLLVYISLVVFSRWLHLAYLPAAALAAFGALGSVAWMMGTYTFLGNALALPFFPLLLPLGRPLSIRLGVFAGLLLAVLTLIFPDGMIVVVGMLAPYVVWTGIQALRSQTFRTFATRICAGLVVWALPMFAYGKVLPETLLGRLGAVLAAGTIPVSPGGGLLSGNFTIHPLQTLNWVPPAFNINPLPPQPLLPDQAPFLIALGGLCMVYVVCCLWSRQADIVFFGLISLGLLLVLGIEGGLFVSDYELFRALAVLYFVPLGVIFMLPMRVGGLVRQGRSRLVATGLVALAMTPLLWRYATNDQYQFNLAYGQHLPDAQYTTDDIQARQDAQKVLGTEPVVLSSETPSFTAFANVLMLFSSTRLGVPNSYYKFVFFTGLGQVTDTGAPLLPRNEQYSAPVVLRNTRYGDIFDPSETRTPILASDDFAFYANDLIPFFDDDTFPVVNAFPLAFLKPRQLAVARTLSGPTDIPFFSTVDRDLDIQLTFDHLNPPGAISVQFDGGPVQSVPVDAAGEAPISGLHASPGLHTLSLGGPAHPVQVTSFRLAAAS